jgi:hypothetical protein
MIFNVAIFNIKLLEGNDSVVVEIYSLGGNKLYSSVIKIPKIQIQAYQKFRISCLIINYNFDEVLSAIKQEWSSVVSEKFENMVNLGLFDFKTDNIKSDKVAISFHNDPKSSFNNIIIEPDPNFITSIEKSTRITYSELNEILLEGPLIGLTTGLNHDEPVKMKLRFSFSKWSQLKTRFL